MKNQIKLLSLLCSIFVIATSSFAAPVTITDVFANTSWRQKKLIVETEFESKDEAPRTVRLDVSVKDADGKVVKKLSQNFEVKKGRTTFKPEISWKDPITWELERGYMYTMNASVKDEENVFNYPAFRFGFREVWRDGRELYMNGHIQRFRTVYYHFANTNGVDFLHDIGYNTIHFSHRIESDPQVDTNLLYHLAERGMAAMTATACFTRGRGRSNPELIAKNLRRYRNIPSCVAFYFGINVNLPTWDKDPRWIGDGSYDWYSDLYKAGKENNPNALFFAHGDGSCCDLATGNLYLNFTPLQEREDWLRKWANPGSGDYPYQACEFGHPFYWVWGKPGFHAYTEYYAMYFGDDVYTEEAEPMRLMRRKIYIRRVQYPFYWKFHELFTWRTFRAWRTYGLNGGVVPFNLEEGYGMPGWDWKYKLWNHYSANYNLKEPVKGRPDWAWPSYDYYQLGNKDFLGYIAGYPDHTTKRHAYWSGEKVTKNAVFIWDHFEPAQFTAKWVVKMEDKEIASGKITERCEIGPILLKDFSFIAPEVAKKTPAVITLVYSDKNGKEIFTDKFDIEFYPAYARDWANAPSCVLVDQSDDSEKVLEGLGITKYTRVKTCNEIPSNTTHVIIGRMALSTTPLALSPEAIEQGQRILILPQMPETWKRFGFTVEDTMSRIMSPRDAVTPAYKNLTRDMLHDWDGQAIYGENFWNGHNFGNICWNGARGPRWTRYMVVSGVPFRTPVALGFIPIIDGEFDMNYSGLMTFYVKKGSITFCQMDFEGRVPNDPAATMTADAVMSEFLSGSTKDNSRPVYAAGDAAKKLLDTINCEANEYKRGTLPTNAVCVVSPDSNMSAKEAAEAAQSGVNIVFYCHTKMAQSAFKLKSKQVIDAYRVKHDRTNPLLRGIGPANLRWRDFMDYPAFVEGPKGWKFDMEGMLAYAKVGKGQIVFCQLDPTLFRRRMFAWEDPNSPLLPTIQVDLASTLASYTNSFSGIKIGGENDTLNMAVYGRIDADRFARETVMPEKIEGRDWNNVDSSVERMYQFWARLLTNLGADAGTASLQRLLWPCGLNEKFEPLPRPLVLGRMPVGEENAAEADVAMWKTQLPMEREAFAGNVKAGQEAIGPDGNTVTWDNSKMEYWKNGTACLWKTADGAKWKGWSLNLLVYEFDVLEGDGIRLRLYSKCPMMRVALNGKDIDEKILKAPSFTKQIPVKPGKNILTIRAISHAGTDRDLIRIATQATDSNGVPRSPKTFSGELEFTAAPRPKVLGAMNVGTLETKDEEALPLFDQKLPGEDNIFAGKADYLSGFDLPDGKRLDWDYTSMEYRGDGTACLWKIPSARDWKGWSLFLLSYEFDVPEGEGRMLRLYSQSPAMRIALNGTDIVNTPVSGPSFEKVIPVKKGRNVLVIKALTHAGTDRDLIRTQLCRTDLDGKKFTVAYLPDGLTFERPERPIVLGRFPVENVESNNLAKLFSTSFPAESSAIAGIVKEGENGIGPHGLSTTWCSTNFQYSADGTVKLWTAPCLREDWNEWCLSLVSYEIIATAGERIAIKLRSGSPAIAATLNEKPLEESPLCMPNFTREIPIQTGRNILTFKILSRGGNDRDILQMSVQRLGNDGLPVIKPYIPTCNDAFEKKFYGPFRTFDAYDYHQY